MKTFLEFVEDQHQPVKGVVDRSSLPQLDDADYALFREFLEDKQVPYTQGFHTADQLMPMQSALNMDKVQGIVKKIGEYHDTPDWWEFFLSKGRKILDGHHRWAAVKGIQPDRRLFTTTVHVSFPELVSLGHEYLKSTRE